MTKYIIDTNTFKIYSVLKRPLTESDKSTLEYVKSKKLKTDPNSVITGKIIDFKLPESMSDLIEGFDKNNDIDLACMTNDEFKKHKCHRWCKIEIWYYNIVVQFDFIRFLIMKFGEDIEMSFELSKHCDYDHVPGEFKHVVGKKNKPDVKVDESFLQDFLDQFDDDFSVKYYVGSIQELIDIAQQINFNIINWTDQSNRNIEIATFRIFGFFYNIISNHSVIEISSIVNLIKNDYTHTFFDINNFVDNEMCLDTLSWEYATCYEEDEKGKSKKVRELTDLEIANIMYDKHAKSTIFDNYKFKEPINQWRLLKLLFEMWGNCGLAEGDFKTTCSKFEHDESDGTEDEFVLEMLKLSFDFLPKPKQKERKETGEDDNDEEKKGDDKEEKKETDE